MTKEIGASCIQLLDFLLGKICFKVNIVRY